MGEDHSPDSNDDQKVCAWALGEALRLARLPTPIARPAVERIIADCSNTVPAASTIDASTR